LGILSLMLPPGVQLGVRDDISLDISCNVRIVRRYSFTNATGCPIDFKWNGQEHVPCAGCNIVAHAPAITIGTSDGASPRLEWDLPTTTLQPEETASVEIHFACPGLVQLNPLRLSLRYQSTWICDYSFAVKPPFGSLIQPTDCTLTGCGMGGKLALILGHDGVLRSEHPVRVSARSGPCAFVIEKKPSPPSRIPLLQYLGGRGGINGTPLNGHVAILIPHLLRDSVPYIQALSAAGLQPDRTFIIGIPYSTKLEVAGALWQLGFRNIETPTSYPFTDTVRQVLTRALKLCRETGQKLLIVEDGGYVGPLLHVEFAADLSLCCGIVEQTRNGIWQYRDQKIEPMVPILNVAESDLKLRRESPLIGDAVVSNVRTLIEQLGKSLHRYQTLVVGYGATGAHVAKSLRHANIDTVVFDQREDRRKQAIADGFRSADTLAALVADRELIIGCTGDVPFQFSEILAIGHQTVFVNASSKRREINYQELDSLTDQNVATEVLAGVGHRRRLVNGKELILLWNGYPVNFVGESVPDQEIAFILALLQQSAIWLAQNAANLRAGFVNVPEVLQKEIEARHDQFIGEKQRARVESVAPERMSASPTSSWFRKGIDWIKGWFR
jgi:S-adenosylhomocysteine hydrolase